MMKTRFWQILASIVVTAYMAVCIASHNRDVPLGKAVYKRLRPMNKVLCLWQNWAMFAPAPTSSSWVHFTGITKAGEEIELEPLYPRLEPGFFRWRYNRLNKLVMSGFGKKRKALRKSLGQYYCTKMKNEGLTLAKVRIDRERHWPASMKRARHGMRPHKNPAISEMDTITCR